MIRYFFITPHMSLAYDIWANNLKNARRRILSHLGRTRLEKHTQIWKA